MARYTQQKQITLSNEDVEVIVGNIMTKEGFSLQTYFDGTQVWHKNKFYLDLLLYVDGYAGLMNLEVWAADATAIKLKSSPIYGFIGNILFKNVEVQEYSIYNFIGDIFFKNKMKNIIQQVLDAVY